MFVSYTDKIPNKKIVSIVGEVIVRQFVSYGNGKKEGEALEKMFKKAKT